MAQFFRPVANDSPLGLNGTFEDINEVTPNDADFMWTDDNTSGELNVLLNNLENKDPTIHTGHIVRCRVSASDGGVPNSVGGSAPDVIITLVQNKTTIATIRPSGNLGNWEDVAYTLSEAEAANITNYGKLHLNFNYSGGGGSPTNRRGIAISWAEIELPDGNASPSIVLETADAVTFTKSAPVELEFTGTDPEGDDVDYEIEISTTPTFDDDTGDISIYSVELNPDVGLFLSQATSRKIGFTFIGEARELNSVTYVIRRQGTVSLTGNVYVEVTRTSHDLFNDTHDTFGNQAHDFDAVLATSDIKDASTFLLSWEFIVFTFDTPITLNKNDGTWYYAARIVFEDGGDSNNRLQVAAVGTGNHIGNHWTINSSNNYSYDPADPDIIHYVKSKRGFSLDKSLEISEKFINTINAGDARPFTSAEKVKYTAENIIFKDDFYPRASKDNFVQLNDVNTKYGQSFLARGGEFYQARFMMAKGLVSPVGPLTAELYAHNGTFGVDGVPTGSPIAISDSIQAEVTLNFHEYFYTFTFPPGTFLSPGTPYFIVMSGTFTATDFVEFWGNNVSPTHQGNGADFNGSWSASTYDYCFEVYSKGELDLGTYYWRARAIDLNGSDRPGDWSETRSFTIDQGGGGGDLGVDVRVAGAWKEGTAAKIKVGGVWKDVAAVKVQTGGAWKTVGSP